MYVHVRMIPHALEYMRYLRGETAYKENPERIVEIYMPTTGHIRGTYNRYMQMRFDCMFGDPTLVGSTIQVTLSPYMEDTVGFGFPEWNRLWRTFLEEMDKIDTVPVKNSQGVMEYRKVEKTNLTNSNQLVCLHKDAVSEVPHIHAAICPVDKNSKKYGLSYLMERAKKAARATAQKLGLTLSLTPNVNNISAAYHVCLDVLLNMPVWSMVEFQKGIDQHGYTLEYGYYPYEQYLLWRMCKEDKLFYPEEISEVFRTQNLYYLWKSLNQPYNEPEEILTSEQILEEIKQQGWYDQFLAGRIPLGKEQELFSILEDQLILEDKQRKFEQMEMERGSFFEDDPEDEEDEGEKVEFTFPYPTDKLCRRILRVYKMCNKDPDPEITRKLKSSHHPAHEAAQPDSNTVTILDIDEEKEWEEMRKRRPSIKFYSLEEMKEKVAEERRALEARLKPMPELIDPGDADPFPEDSDDVRI